MASSKLSLVLAIFVSLATSTYSRIHYNPSTLTRRTYDYIVIGAGTAGNVIATRLAEDSSVNVLVIEAGLTNVGIQEGIIPLFAPRMTPNRPWNWNFTAAPQTELYSRSFPYPTGRLLGGGSSVNYQIFTKGPSADFDRIARITGDSEWSWESLWEGGYVNKPEKFVPPTDKRDISNEYNYELHGYNGPLQVTLTNQQLDFNKLCIAATKDQPTEFPFNLDTNSGNPLGVGYITSTTGHGVRSSSATAYLETLAKDFPNLDVLMDSLVQKIEIEQTTAGKRATGVVGVSSGPAVIPFNLLASTEIIISAGAINTPKLLMLSGIGDPSELANWGIPLVHSLPDVGKNLQDHPLLPSQWYVNSKDTTDTLSRDPEAAAKAMQQYQTSRTGPFANSVAGIIGFFRLPRRHAIFNTMKDPVPADTSPHYELLFGNGFVGILNSLPPTGNFMTILNVLLSPTSRGTVTLGSANVYDLPVVDPAFLTTEFDKTVMREAFKKATKFLTSASFAEYVDKPFGPVPGPGATNEEIDRFVKTWTTTIWHPSSTAAMSSKAADHGVVNPDLNVKGISGLRIVDASVFPFVPAAHPQAPIYILAEKAADIIKASRRSASDSAGRERISAKFLKEQS